MIQMAQKTNLHFFLFYIRGIMKAFFYNILTTSIYYVEDQEILELRHNL